MNEDDIRAIIQEELQKIFTGDSSSIIPNMKMLSDRIVMQKSIQILDAKNIQVGRSNGTMIGTGSDQKLSFYGVTPIVQQNAIAAPSGTGTAGVDSPARTAINSIISFFHSSGLTK